MAAQLPVCLVGAGRVAQVHASTLARHIPEAKLAALVDPDRDALQKTAARFEIERRFPTLEQALERAHFEAVVITTPTFTHKELAVQAAKAGKHIFLEKPMALTLEECDAVIAGAESNGVILQLGFMRRFAPEFVAAAERIEAGEIGRPMVIKSLTHGPGLPPPWARDLKTSNGLLAEVNSHDWDCVRWLMAANPERVYAEVANFKGRARGVDAENFYDNALVNIRFENGGLGNISGVCPCDYGYDARVEIVGEKGIMQIGELRGLPLTVVKNRDEGALTPVTRSWPERFASAYIAEMRHFTDCILTGSQPKVGGLDGRWAVAGVLAATKSFLEGRVVYLQEVLKEAVPL